MTWQIKQRYLAFFIKFNHQFSISIILFVILIVLFKRYINYSNLDIQTINLKIEQQLHINKLQLQKNNHLKQQIRAVNNLEILESEARYRLGLLKYGETYYQF
jgi:cell division protein FtsB